MYTLSIIRMLFLLLWMLNYDEVLASNKYTIPRVSCPVGYSLDAAWFFKTYKSTVNVDVMYEAYLVHKKNNNLENALNSEIGTESLSGQELIDAVSLYYAVKRIVNRPPSNKPLINRIHLDLYSHELTPDQNADTKRKYLRWHWGYMSDQEVIMDLCGSPGYFPSTGPRLPQNLGT